MPIYAYRCSTCGHAQDVLQKMSDPQLTVCPACGAAAFEKQLTAAGFQLKGSGWYVTDFRGGNTAAGAKKDGDEKPADVTADKPAEKAGDKPVDKAAEKSPDKPAEKAPTVAPAPAAATPSSSPPAASA